jgi:hypothetical protein
LSVPSDIESYLTQNEEIVRTEKSEGWEIYVTNKRIILRKHGIFAKKVIEASYRYISSIEYSKSIPIIRIVAGIVAIIMSLVWQRIPQLEPLNKLFATSSWFIPLVIFVLGLVLILDALLVRPSYMIHIVGREPIVVSAKLEGIIRTIRQYQERVEAKIVEKD